MPEIYPFKALLPAPGLELQVSANTHVDDKKRQIEIIHNNPNSYLQVVKPYLKFNEDKDPEKHFPFSKIAIEKLIAEKVMIREEKDSLYVYNQVNNENGQQYLGLICNVSAQDYYEDKIKVHENTLTEKENQLISHIKMCGAIGEPVLLTHFYNSDIEDLLNFTIHNQIPNIEFTDEVNRKHLIYKVQDFKGIEAFKSAYKQLKDFYIADGHHRSAASAGYYKKEGITNGHYLAFLVPANHLHIDSFYRAYKSNREFDSNNFLEKLSEFFEIKKVIGPFAPTGAREFGLCLKNNWYTLKYTGKIDDSNAVNLLDVSILETNVFKVILDIHDTKTDQQLAYIKGNTEISIIDKEVNAGLYDLVFTVYPCMIEEVFNIADQGLIMPPKSTYIEPKLRTGLTVQIV